MVNSGANNFNRSQEEETEQEGHQCRKGAGFSPAGTVHAKASVEGEQSHSGAQTNRCSDK